MAEPHHSPLPSGTTDTVNSETMLSVDMSNVVLDELFDYVHTLVSDATEAVEAYAEVVVGTYQETNNVEWLALRQLVLQQHQLRLRDLVHYGELRMDDLQRGIEEFQFQYPPPTPSVADPEQSIQPDRPHGIRMTAGSHTAGSDYQSIHDKIGCSRDRQGRLYFVLTSPCYSPNATSFQEYPLDEEGILWHHRKAPQFGRGTWTGYYIQASPWNLEIIEAALAYLVDYKDALEADRHRPALSAVGENKLSMRVRYPGSDNWVSTTGSIFFHFSSPEGNELIRSPIAGTTFSPVWLTGSDIVFSMEEKTLEKLYDLCQRLASGI